MAALEWRPDARARQDFLDALEMAAEEYEINDPERVGVADGGAPSWWDEEEAGAEALEVAARLREAKAR